MDAASCRDIFETIRVAFDGSVADNDSYHNSWLLSELFASRRVEVLDWPIHSPDLNIIQHLCYEFEKLLTTVHASNTSMKFEHIEGAWQSISMHLVDTLIYLMPRHSEGVIKAKG